MATTRKATPKKTGSQKASSGKAHAAPRTAVTVLGMHRSGTSLLTRAINLMGYAVPENRIGINKTNESGHWESRHVARLNDSLLESAGLTWHSWSELDLRAVPSRVLAGAREDIANIVHTEWGGADRVVIKEPRMCRFVELYRSALAEAGFRSVYALPLRNPLEVMASLERRNGMAAEDAALLWLRHVLEAEAGTRGQPRAFLHYESLIADPVRELDRLCQLLEIDPPYSPAIVEGPLCELADPGKRHHAASAEALAHDPVTRGWVSEAFEALRVLAGDEANADARGVLDRIHEDFRRATPALLMLREVIVGKAAEAEKVEAELEQARAENHTIQSEAANQATQLEAALESSRKELDVSRADSAARVAGLESALASLQDEHKAFEQRAGDAANAAKAKLKSARAELEAEKARHAGDLDALETALNAARTELGSLRDDSAKRETELREQLTDARTANAELISQSDEQARSSDKLRGELSALQASHAELERENGEYARNQNRLRKKLDEVEDAVRDRDARLKTQRSRIRGLERDMWKLRDHLSVKSEHYDALLGSTSWRVTRPLRVAKRFVSTGRVRPKGLEAAPPPPRLTHQTPTTPSMPAVAARPTATSPPTKFQQGPARRALESSGLFDPSYYVANAPDLGEADPLEHFLHSGWKSGADPSAAFTTKAYLAANPDSREHPLGPLGHFLDTKGTAGAKDLGRVGRMAVFGAISGGYDLLKDPQHDVPGVDYVLFTDGDVPDGSLWQKREFEFVSPDPTRTARFVKTHPHLYFADYDWAVWVDSNLAIASDPRSWVADLEDRVDLATWHHPLRTTVQEEAKACMARSKDDSDVIREQMNRYTSDGFPDAGGLWETSVFASRPNRPEIVDMMNLWWAEILKGSRRDQLALPYALWRSEVTIAPIAPRGVCMRSDPRFHYHRHVG